MEFGFQLGFLFRNTNQREKNQNILSLCNYYIN